MKNIYFVVLVSLFHIACRNSDSTAPNSFNDTANSLKSIGLAVFELLDQGEKLEECNSKEDLFKRVSHKGRLDWLLATNEDSWGNKFKWVFLHKKDVTIIKIISHGPNGRYEAGEGDDFYVQIKLFPDHSSEGVLKFLTEERREQLLDFARWRNPRK